MASPLINFPCRLDHDLISTPISIDDTTEDLYYTMHVSEALMTQAFFHCQWDWRYRGEEKWTHSGASQPRIAVCRCSFYNTTFNHQHQFILIRSWVLINWILFTEFNLIFQRWICMFHVIQPNQAILVQNFSTLSFFNTSYSITTISYPSSPTACLT